MESNKKIDLDKVTRDVLKMIDSYGFKQEGAYNLRLNGMAVCHGDSRHINIVKKEDKPGIDERAGAYSGRDVQRGRGYRLQ